MHIHKAGAPTANQAEIEAYVANQGLALEPASGERFSEAAALRRRRIGFVALNAVTIGLLFAAMAYLLGIGGLKSFEWAMLFAFSLTLPWLSIGFWNALIGFVLAVGARNPAIAVNPYLARDRADMPITTRTAIVMAVRNEDVDAFIARLEGMHADLCRNSFAAHFDVHVLSDTTDDVIARSEAAAVDAWRRRAPGAIAIHYRRRTSNEGYKAGNISEFCDRTHADYDFFLPLDADSRMSADAILRLVRVMQAAPEIGILQGLVVGEASRTFFTRAFQFGMRHGMRSYTLGAAWWQGDCGPYWGHNALIRMDAFQRHCRLPMLSGKGPFSGHILSHDQVEAVLMRGAGFEVRVVAEEDASFEENPPSLPDFIKRETRWCQGNMQYWRLLAMPGIKRTSRAQLLLAILMYLGAPAWILFITIGAAMAVSTEEFGAVPLSLGLGLFATMMFFNLMPKLMGVAQSLASARAARSYGGRLRILVGAIGEFVFSTLISPSVAFAITICCVGLAFGERVSWSAQQRSRERLTLREAARTLWPQTLFGLTLAAVLAAAAPWALLFGAPIVAPLCLAIPLAALTTLPALGRGTRWIGLFDIPEERVQAAPATVPAAAARAA